MRYGKTRPLASGYQAEIDAMGEEEWNQAILRFSDGNINQSWSFGQAMSPQGRISQLALKRDGEIAALALTRISRLPIVGLKIAYVSWGPLWRRRDREPETEAFRQMLRALRNEYACRRGMILRVYPFELEDGPPELLETLCEEGFCGAAKEAGDRTLLLDLRPGLEKLQANLVQKWRYWLRRANKEIVIDAGCDESLLERFLALYEQMLERKSFFVGDVVPRLQQIQARLPEAQKLRVYIARTTEGDCAGSVISTLGATGVELFAATNPRGMQSCASYPLHWKLIEEMKAQGCTEYNLNGVNPEGNPGVYRFKRGLAGKSGHEARYLGKFDIYPGAAAHLFMHAAGKARKQYRKWRPRLERLAKRGAKERESAATESAQ